MRVTDKQVTLRVERMQAAGMDIGIDGPYGRFRVTTRDGSRDLSPRAGNREILDWLDAFEQGWEAGTARTVDHMRHGREVVDAEGPTDRG